MSWEAFHYQCRLKATGNTLATDADLSPYGPIKSGSKAYHLLTQINQLEKAAFKQTARLYGQLDFSLQSRLNSGLKNTLSYMTLVFVMFMLVSLLHIHFVWPNFDTFFLTTMPELGVPSAPIKDNFFWIIVASFAITLCCWLYFIAYNQLLTSTNLSSGSRWVLPKNALLLVNNLISIYEYPLCMANAVANNLQQHMKSIQDDEELLLCELKQLLQLNSDKLTHVLRRRMQKLLLLNGIVMVFAISQLLYINYQRIFDIGTTI